jgi:branched-chain amino acid transport system permease protein
MLDFLLQQLITGLALGIIYGVIAVCIVLIYKSTRVLNLAQGELLVFGAFFAWTALVVWQLPLPLAFLASMVATGFLGFLIERLTLRPLIGQPILAAIMMTISIMVVLKGMILLAWGGAVYSYKPPIFPKEPVQLGTVVISQEYAWASALAIVLLVLFMYFFQRTRAGLAMRGTSEDHQLAQSLGVSVENVFAQSWIIAAVVSAVVGIVLASLFSVDMGIGSLGLKVFAVVLLGGLESIPGAIVAGLIIGVSEMAAAGFLDPIVGGGIREVFPWLVAVVVLIFLPYGLFGWKRIERI